MNSFYVRAALGALLVIAACRGKSESDATAGMTAEEHARMLARNQGATTVAQGDRAAVHLTAEQARAIGVTYATVTRGPLRRVIRTVGQVTPAEPNLVDVTARIDGFVERLDVNATGVAVRRGEPLLAIYSPMLVAAQEELLTAKRLAASVDSSREAWQRAQQLLAASRRRLAYWDIPAAQIEQLERTGELTKTMTLAAPTNGVVLEKMVVEGQAVMPGMRLYRLADLSTVWVEGDVFEQDLAFIRVGAPVRAELAAYAGRTFIGRVSFVAPTVDQQTRTARVRVALPNRDGALRPGMYATLYFAARVAADALTVPAEAVVMTGQRNLVFVVTLEGTLEPRDVVVGTRGDGRVQILRGVAAGDRIVASANFLVDAESRLAPGAGMPEMPGMTMPAKERRP